MDNQAVTLLNGNNDYDYIMTDEDFKRIKASIGDIEAGNFITIPQSLSQEEIRDFILNSNFD